MGVIFGSTVIGSLAGFFGIKKLEKQKADEVLLKFKDKKIYGVCSKANFFGQESFGMSQMRGNGILVLTEDELFFQMWAPKKELSIAIGDISGVETPKIFLGKTKFKSLLKVLFKNDKNESDSAAWLVGNLPEWQTSIEKIIQSKV